MQAHETAIRLAGIAKKDLNEADSRHRVIDPVLHDVLGWPRSKVACEEYIAPGFADYVLRNGKDDALLLIEAKREGAYFELPASLNDGESGFYVSVKTLLTTPSIRAAIEQVRTYCVDNGCDFAAITNGHQWVFFRTYQKGADWRNLKAFVIPSLAYFANRFIEAENNFGYTSITQMGSLRKLLLDSSIHNRELFYPKAKITAYTAPVDANQYASMLRPLADHFFGVFPIDDATFLEECYVSDREYDIAFASARRRLEDELTPYLQSFSIKNFSDAATGGQFANRLSKSLIEKRPGDVVILFGGKGVGKSTFLNKLLFWRPPQIVKKHSIICLVDLLKNPDIADAIEKDLWRQLNSALDDDGLLSQERAVLERLFADRFDLAKKQQLYGIDEKSEYYNIQVNSLIGDWKQDAPYVATRLAEYWKTRHKTPIVVVDNTDQFSSANQELCFTIAQDVSRRLSCLVVISMREERFHASSIHGVLDAYQNSGFHITAPPPREVFLRRIDYIMKLIKSEDGEYSELLPYNLDKDVLRRLLVVLRAEFTNRSSHLAGFLEACSHGNIRLALDLFRGFIVSGYTNIREITASETWTLQTHQVIKPFMIPSRFFYDEELSKIPNLYQVRSKSHGSHFTALRILSKLLTGHDRTNAPFVPVATLALDFIEVFAMREDFELNIDLLLRHRLVESNNRLEQYDANVDSVRATAYGAFVFHVLSRAFTYLELVASDCAISSAEVSNELTEISNEEYRLYVTSQRFERVQKRIQKADAFIKYLEMEEEREADLFKLSDPKISKLVRDSFTKEQASVLKSARRNK